MPDSHNTRFLVAKYIPDLHRLEPRNIGVIVWSNGATSAKFLGEPVAGGDDSARVPGRLGVQNQDTYREWIHYWRTQMSAAALSANGNGKRVSRESPAFVDALKRCSKKNFVLVDGGFVTGEVTHSEVEDVVADLFSSLCFEPVGSRKSQSFGLESHPKRGEIHEYATTMFHYRQKGGHS